MAILDDIKISLRISSTNFNTEISDLINACQEDLKNAGVLTEYVESTDYLIKRAINCYVKGEFSYNNPDAERFIDSYEKIKMVLTSSPDYAYHTLVFTVTDLDSSTAIHEAAIKLWNVELNYNETQITDINGQTTFYLKPGTAYKYDVTANNYYSDLHSDTDKNIIDMDGSTTIAITLDGV